MRSQKKFYGKLKVLPLAVFLGACSFIPSYQQPNIPVAEKWMDFSLKASDQGEQPSVLGWRDYFKDPQLQSLIQNALEHNHDLRTAVLNMEKAAEQYHIKNLDQLPTISLSASGQRQGQGESVYGNSFSAGVGFTSFELDFFGRIRALTEASLNSYLQTKEARDSAQLSVIQSVAQGYYTARINKNLMDLSQQVLKSREQTYQLGQSQFNVGIIDEVTLRGYENAIEVARSSYFAYQRAYQQAVNALSVLVGLPVNQINLPQMNGLNEQFADIKIPENIPSSVLDNRPDVRMAEYALRAANADIGVAKAALFPTISLTGSFGYASTELNKLLTSSGELWSFMPSLTVPIFNRAQLNSNVRISEIDQRILVESYQSAVESAFQEVGNALIARETYDKEYKSSVKAAAAQHRVLNLEKMRFQVGVIDGMDLLDAERNDFSARQTVLNTQLGMLNNLVTLYTAMGGGLLEKTDPQIIQSDENPKNDGLKMPQFNIN